MVKNLPASVEDVRFNPWFDLWVRKILWSRKWQPFAVFLPEKFHGQRRLWATVHGIPKSQIRQQLSTLWYQIS